MTMHHKTHYDTLSTHGLAKGSRAWFAQRRARKLGLAQGGGRLAKFREVARHIPIGLDEVLRDELPKVAESEYWFYVWNVGPVLCAYCNEKLTRSSKTKDHVIPRASGGSRLGRENLVPACRDCNGQKGHASLLRFLLEREQARHGRLCA